jgi:hypothetical protein
MHWSRITGEIGEKAWRTGIMPDQISLRPLAYSLGATALCDLGQWADANDLLRLGLNRNRNEVELREKYA